MLKFKTGLKQKEYHHNGNGFADEVIIYNKDGKVEQKIIKQD